MMRFITSRTTAISLAIALVFAVCSKASASLPPPQPFLSAEPGAAKSKTVRSSRLMIRLNVARNRIRRAQFSPPRGFVTLFLMWSPGQA